MTEEQRQKELSEHLKGGPLHDRNFDDRYPVWRCPDCQSLNRFADTFGEPCRACRADHTSDWTRHIVDEEIRESWEG